MKTVEIPNRLYSQLESIRLYRQVVDSKNMKISQVIEKMRKNTEGVLW